MIEKERNNVPQNYKLCYNSAARTLHGYIHSLIMNTVDFRAIKVSIPECLRKITGGNVDYERSEASHHLARHLALSTYGTSFLGKDQSLELVCSVLRGITNSH